MSKVRLSVLAVIVALFAFAPVFTTRAQSCPPGLEQADCDLITAAFAGVAGIQSFGMDYTVDFKLAGTPQDVALNVKGTGSIDLAALMAAGGSDITKLAFQTALEAALDAAGNKQAGKLELRIVDGALYINGDVATGGKWIKNDLAKLAGQVSGMASGTAGSTGANPTEALALVSALTSAVDPAKLITFSAADSDAGRVITLNVNLAELLPAFENDAVLEALKKTAGPSASTLTKEQVKQLATFLKPTLEATKVAVSWTVNKETKAFAGVNISLSTTIDPTLAMMAGGAAGADAKPITIDFALDVKLSKVNEPVKVEVPADAVAQ